jgi:MoxR-like ATPase
VPESSHASTYEQGQQQTIARLTLVTLIAMSPTHEHESHRMKTVPDAGPVTSEPTVDDVEGIKQLRQAYVQVTDQLGRVIVGQNQVIEELLVAMFARGHALLVGVPGLAKTLLISSLSKTLSLTFKRIQFTPDLMPSDITGTEILQDDPETGQRRFTFLKGPIFANIVLADEINRTPPKTQAALLEAMQEKSVSSGGTEYRLEAPFFVLATQNPIEQEGTYPLPEAQLDRFLFNIKVDYPARDEELEVMRRITGSDVAEIKPVLDRRQILALQELVRRVPVPDHVYEYALALVRSTRSGTPEAPDFVGSWLAYGAGPRASMNLILAGKARAALQGRFHVSVGDIQAVALPVLRHRIVPSFAAQSEGLDADALTRKLMEAIPTDERLYEKTAH